jgi:hypothetical protein
MVSSDDIGMEGRRVKCKKCQHIWTVDGEKKIIDELISRIQETEIEVDDIDFGEMKKVVKPKKAEISLKAYFSSLLSKLPKFHYLSMGGLSFHRFCSAFMVALALCSIISYGLVALRWSVVKVIPSLSPLYISLGFHMFPYANVNPEESLIIENKNIQTIGDKKVLNANLINLSSNLVRVPNLKITYLDEGNKLILEEKRAFSFSIMPKEFSHNFYFSLPKKLSNDVKIIRFSFVD